MNVPAYPLLVETFGVAQAEQLCEVAHIPVDSQASLCGRIRSNPTDFEVVDVIPSPDGLTLVKIINPYAFSAPTLGLMRVRTEFEGQVTIAYRTTVVEFDAPKAIVDEFDDRDQWPWYTFELHMRPLPTVYGPNGTPLVWRSDEVNQLQQTVLAVQDGFANIARAFSSGMLSADDTKRAVERLVETPVPHIELGRSTAPPIVKTRKIKV